MTEETKRKRDEAADKETDISGWDNGPGHCEGVAFREGYVFGFDAGYAEAQAEMEQLKRWMEFYNKHLLEGGAKHGLIETLIERDALKAEVERWKHSSAAWETQHTFLKAMADKLAGALKRAGCRHHTDCDTGDCVDKCPVRIKNLMLAEYRAKYGGKG